MRISLLISTYNWPKALSICLKSVLSQTLAPLEVVIADDGSDERTKAVIDAFRTQAQFAVKHVWQPDEGFRAAAIRNKAIAVCEGDYVVQIDGDMVMHPLFLTDHARAARPGYFLSGVRVNTTPEFTAELLEKQSPDISFWSKGLIDRYKSVRCYPLSPMMRWHKANTYRYGLGCNMSFWRKDLLAVNGYDNSFEGWGAEDSDLMCRLMISGIKKSSLRLGGIAFHLYHNSRKVSEITKRNFLILDKNALKGAGVCENGIVRRSESANL